MWFCQENMYCLMFNMKTYRKLNKMWKCNKKNHCFLVIITELLRCLTCTKLWQESSTIQDWIIWNPWKLVSLSGLNKKSHLKGKLNMVGSAATIFLCQICWGLLKWFDLSMAAEFDWWKRSTESQKSSFLTPLAVMFGFRIKF